jgi:hypothetical protein
MIALLLIRSRRANVLMIAVLILLITIPYWDAGKIRARLRHFHYSSAG